MNTPCRRGIDLDQIAEKSRQRAQNDRRRTKDGRFVAALHDRIVRLGVRLTNGRLYALRGACEVKLAHEARIFAELGVRTPARPGF